MAIILVLFYPKSTAPCVESFLDYDDALDFFLKKIKEMYPQITHDEVVAAMKAESHGAVHMCVTHPRDTSSASFRTLFAPEY